MVINGYVNLKHKINTRILQGLLISLIFFLIYINGAFLEVETQLSQMTCLLYIDYLRFLTVGNFVLEIKKALEKVEKTTLD